MGCKLEKCTCSLGERPTCANFEPSRGSKYARCLKFITTRSTCPLDVSACPTCEHHIPEQKAGRPRQYDPDDHEDLRRRRALAARRWRAKKAGKTLDDNGRQQGEVG